LPCKDTSVSELWTPGGGEPSNQPEPPPDAGEGPSPEELAAMRQLHEQLRSTPMLDVIANHVLGLWQLGLVYLGVATPPDENGQVPAPDLMAAGLAIDAAAAIVDGLGDRLGEYEATLREALGQAQMLFVQVAEAIEGGAGSGS